MSKRLDTARRAWVALRQLAQLSPDERIALLELASTAATENVRPRQSATVSDEAIVSSLASMRFAERVEIGPRASVGPFCCIWGGWSTAWARVGADALLSPGVVMVAGNHGTQGTGPVRDAGFEEADVVVGEGAWIGAHAVLVGCRVGAGAVIGANAVVVDDVPDLAIAVGSPARVIGRRQ
ncbi:MAG TPA: acyltransferase [Mycobacteriales bacterium]|nr:acyltransferase [Mycobacteriales bacterium]